MSRKFVMIMVLMLFLGVLGVVFKLQRVKANGPIYIRADGSIDPPTVNITTTDYVTYTFTGNVNDSVVVERSNITIDGQGYGVVGPESIPSYAGIHVEGYLSVNVTIRNVTVMSFLTGISLISTNDNKILDCSITDNIRGIWSVESMYNVISGNNITYNEYGVYFNTVSYTELSENNITDNDNGVWLEFSSVNKFYHNWFVNNVNHTYIEQGNPNAWNETYPIGGNYWDNFTERYPGVGNDFSGPDQDIPGSDGFWDGPYEIDGDNIDHYPIVPEFPSILLMPLLMIVTMSIVIVCRRERSL